MRRTWVTNNRASIDGIETDIKSHSRSNYINGNYFVHDLIDGGKEKRLLRTTDSKFIPDFPDSIDLKITNKCNKGCPYCHESSCPSGKSFNLDRTISMLDELPSCGIEIAIGGGNVLEIPEDAAKLINWCREKGFSVRTTLNYEHLLPYTDYLKSMGPFSEENEHTEVSPSIKTIIRKSEYLGVSISKFEPNVKITDGFILSSKVVFHVIVGLFPIEDLVKMLGNLNYKKILILGFKQFGRAEGMAPEHLDEWRRVVKKFIYDFRKGGKGSEYYKTIGFDNLAIEQLGIRDILLSEEWDRLYFGDEFTCSMYVDAVNETFAPTSRSLLSERVSWSSTKGIIDYFKNNRND